MASVFVGRLGHVGQVGQWWQPKVLFSEWIQSLALNPMRREITPRQDGRERRRGKPQGFPVIAGTDGRGG